MNFRQVFLVREKKPPGFGPHQIFCGGFCPTVNGWHRCEANPTMVLTALQSESQAQRAAFWVKFQMPMCWMDSPSPPSTECKVYHGVWNIFRFWNFNLKLHGFATGWGGRSLNHVDLFKVIIWWRCWCFSFRPVNYLRWGLSSCSLLLFGYQVGPVK